MSKHFFKYIFFAFLLFTITQQKNIYAISEGDFKYHINTDEEGNFDKLDIQSPYTKNGVNVLDDSVSKGTVWNKVLIKYKVLIIGFMGFSIITLIAIFMFNFLKLSTAVQNPQKRTDALMGIGITILASGILGAAIIFFGYAYNVFR